MFKKLKELREYEGLTQKEIADILNVTRSTYAGWETGKDIIPLPKLNDFANYFHVSLDYLVGNSPTIKMKTAQTKIEKEVVANRLKQFRKSKHLSQKKLAEAMNTSQPNIHKYESGKSLITTSYALEFSKKFDYSLDDLLKK